MSIKSIGPSTGPRQELMGLTTDTKPVYPACDPGSTYIELNEDTGMVEAYYVYGVTSNLGTYKWYRIGG